MATNEPNKPDNVINIDPGKREQIEKTPAPDQPPEVVGNATAPEMTAGPDKAPAPPAPEEKAPEPEKKRRGGRPPKADKAVKPEKEPKPEKAPKAEKSARPKKAAAEKEAPAPEPELPPQPREAPRPNGKDQIVYINLAELQPFKNHPFGVRDDSEMKALVESVKTGGVNQPALVRPIEGGGYEIIAGHRRQKASELAGYFEMPCIVREMTDDEAVLAMTDDNLRQRSVILPSEKAASLKMQFEAIKHQGASGQNVPKEELGKRSIEIVGQRNTVDGKPMNGKQVQRYIRLTDLVPDLQKAIDEDRLGFTAAVEISFIKPKNQNFIAVALESEQAKPSTEQAKRMRELDKKGLLNGDVIDGILCEEKKEELKVIISGKELETYFGKEKTPQQMKEQIIKLLDDWAGKEKGITAPEKKTDREK